MPGFLAFKVIFKEKKRIKWKKQISKTKNGYLIHAWWDEAFSLKSTVVNCTCHSIKGESLDIMTIVP